eukprot:TRINITY_DN5889_c0_g5_i1.p1 TRINITY_DN5889_c0_g5~~TRINITY_DN5889_c0_g5_i1.p1  ORF type:complete len:117 (+),score=1.51 TRINITY_DN5889_c0_g5_i1:853-1203(+)
MSPFTIKNIIKEKGGLLEKEREEKQRVRGKKKKLANIPHSVNNWQSVVEDREKSPSFCVVRFISIALSFFLFFFFCSVIQNIRLCYRRTTYWLNTLTTTLGCSFFPQKKKREKKKD